MISSVVYSSQTGVHASLTETVEKHCSSEWKQPIREHTRQAFEGFLGVLGDSALNGFILDVGCGTGQSAVQLAKQFPHSLVVGIDRSVERLGRGIVNTAQKQELLKQPVVIGNCVLLRAEVADFWRLLKLNNIKPEKIFIFYPNPWPKSGHLLRRWHAHPVFPTLMGFGVPIELRSNWKIYLQEFALAVEIITANKPQLELMKREELADAFSTPFEKKYYASGHALWCLQTKVLSSRP